jgi:hypothetical protein
LAWNLAADPLVESFYPLLSYTDVLVLQQFRPSKRSASISPW